MQHFLGPFPEFYGTQAGWIWKVVTGGMVLLGIASLGGLLEGRRWALGAETLRLLGMAAMTPVWMPGTDNDFIALAVVAGFTLGSLFWLGNYWGFFQQSHAAAKAA